jgi:predicted amino acid-binding ACT domain protein
MTFARLRIELPDHPGARAAASRVLAAQGLNVVEVSIHEVEGARAVDEIVVHAESPFSSVELGRSLDQAGADLLSVAPCEIRGDPTVTALTWVSETLEHPSRKSSLATGVRLLTGIDPVYVCSADDAKQWPIGAIALRDGSPVVMRLDCAPEPLRSHTAGDAGVWVLAAPDARNAAFVVLAARPYTIRFTATEVNRLVAVLDCKRRLALMARAPGHDGAINGDGRIAWGRGLASNA